MDFIQILLLSLVQGIAEFLPISSSGHLIILPQIMQWSDQGLEIDIAMHIGTLLAVVVYFYKDSIKLLVGSKDICFGKKTEAGRLVLNIAVATLPILIAGFFLKEIIEEDFRNVRLIGITSIIFGLLLFFADKSSARTTNPKPDEFSIKDAFVIGLAQMIALIPGVSRSGITMTTSLFLGYSRTQAAKFSLLLSIPVTAAAGLLIGYGIYQHGSPALIKDAVLTAVLAFVFGYATIAGMMRWLAKFSFTPFVVYRVILGIILLSFFAI